MQAIGRIENGPLLNLSCLPPHALVDHSNQICERSGTLSSISRHLAASRLCFRSAFHLLQLSSIMSTGFVTAASLMYPYGDGRLSAMAVSEIAFLSVAR